jgi:proton glutamate symport protein
MSPRQSIWFAVTALFLALIPHVFQPSLGLPPDGSLLTGVRWAAIAALCWAGFKNSGLTTWILISMVVGAELGIDTPQFAGKLEVLSKIFIQLIKTIIAPLLFATLVVGIAGQGSSKQLGRISIKAFSYFLAATSIALVVGLLAINWSQAGKGIANPLKTGAAVSVPGEALTAQVDTAKGIVKLYLNGKELTAAPPPVKQDWKKILLHTFPENISKMVYEGAALQIVVFSLLFGLGLRQVSETHRKTMLHWCEALAEAMFKFTGIIMYFAPFAVGGAVAYTIGTMGFDVVWNLLQLLGTLYIALIVFILLVFIPVMLFFRIPIRKFFKRVYEPASLAFATASSEAALPQAMEAMEKFGVPRKIVAFVIPTGYSFNLDGSTLYLALASIFCAQAAGMELSWGTQIVIMLTLLLTSKGVAGVPRASLVILAATVQQFDIPEWPIAIILGIDALMDMGRTSVNLVGNCLASAVVARWEGEFDDEADV